MLKEEHNDLSLLDTWRDIINSSGWGLFKDLLQDHQDYLEEQVLVNVRSRDFERATEMSNRADECRKILQLVESRLSELKKEKK